MIHQKKVICFGTFDVLHLGHLNYFQQAKKLGNHLTVVIARDKTKQQQNKKTLFSEKERLKLVKNLKIVDEAVLGSLNNHLKIIQEKKPDLICLGYDQKINEKTLAKDLFRLNPTLKIRRMKPYQPKKYKSSKIKNFFSSITKTRQ